MNLCEIPAFNRKVLPPYRYRPDKRPAYVGTSLRRVVASSYFAPRE